MPTLEGAFHLRDHASDQLKKMRKNAEETDLAFKKLGMTMDGVSSKKRQTNLLTTARAMRVLGVESETAAKKVGNFHRQVKRGDKDLQNWGQRLKLVATGTKSFAGELFKIAKPGGMLYGFGSLIGVAAQAVGNLGLAAVALTPRLIDMGVAGGALIPILAGLVGGMHTLKTVSKDIGTALGGGPAGNQAIREMGRQGAVVVRQIRRMRLELRQLKQEATTPVYRQLAAAIPTLRGALMPVARGFNRRIGGAVAGLIPEATRMLTSRGTMTDIGTIGRSGATSITNLGRALLSVLHALIGIGAAAAPFTNWLTKQVSAFARWIDKTVAAHRASGQLQARFVRLRHELAQFGEFLSNTGHALMRFFADARPAGEQLYGWLVRVSRGWRAASDNTASTLRWTRLFLSSVKGFETLATLAGHIVTSLLKMGGGQGMGSVASALDKLLPVLTETLNMFANTFGPPLAKLLGTVGKTLSLLGGTGGPFVTLVNVVNQLLTGFNKLLAAVGPLGRVLGKMLEVGLIVRFASKIGLIELGWRRVAVAAGEAAVAEDAALFGVPGLRAGRLLRPFSRGAAATGAAATGAATEGAAVAEGASAATAGSWLSRFRGAKWRGSKVPAVLEEGGKVAAPLEGALGAAGGEAALVGQLGKFGMLGKIGTKALGFAGRLALPLTVLTGILGGITAGRSGSIGHQTVQTLYGIGQGATGGLLGGALGLAGMHNILETPEHTQARLVAASQRQLGGILNEQGKGTHNVGVLNRQVDQLVVAMREFSGNTSDAAKRYVDQLQQEAAARRSLIDRINQEKQARSGRVVSEAVAAANRAAQTAGGGPHGRAVAAAQLWAKIRGAPGDPLSRLHLEEALLTQEPGQADRIVAFEAGLGRRIRVAGGRIFRGGKTGLGVVREFKQVGGPDSPKVTSLLRQKAAAQLEALGLSPAQAQADVRRWAGGGELLTPAELAGLDAIVEANIARGARRGNFRPSVIPPPTFAPGTPGQPPIGRRAGGGRIPGVGLHDTVAAAGLVAPGELVVNRHTERKVNYLLGGAATLGGLVNGESTPHSARGATGMRGAGKPTTSYHGYPMPHQRIATFSDLVLSRFPALSVSSTTRGGHVHGSLHYLGEAVDLQGPTATMQRAGSWIQSNLGSALLEGIHNNTLSVKNGKPVSAMYWGGKTWAGHRNHIHIAAGDQGGLPGGAPVGAAKRLPLGISAAAPLNSLARSSSAMFGVGGLGFAGDFGPETIPAPGAEAGAPAAPGVGYTKASLVRLARMTGFPNANLAAAVAMAESTGNPSARNLNTDGSIDRGLWQINSIHSQYPGARLFDPAYNAQAAFDISGGGRSWSPWVTYNTGAYKKYLSRGGRLHRWGGWHQGGLDATFNTPTMIGVGEAGKERVTVTPAGKHGGPGGVTFHNYFSINGGNPGDVQREIESALDRFADQLDRHYGSDAGGIG